MISDKLYKEIQHLSIDTQLDLLRQTEANIYRRSLYKTTRDLLGYKDVNLRTHGNVIQCLERESKRKLVVMPRGSLKSTICTIAYPIWCLLKNPNERIIIDSEVYTNSKNFLREITAHMFNPNITELFGEFYNKKNWTEGEITIKQRTVPKKEASITCSGIGAGKTSQHYSIAILDDMNSPKNSSTIEGRRKVIDHYRMYMSLLEPDGTLIVVGTRYSDDDLIGHILKNELDIKFV